MLLKPSCHNAFLSYQYKLGSDHKNLHEDKRRLLVGPVEFHLSEKSSIEL